MEDGNDNMECGYPGRVHGAVMGLTTEYNLEHLLVSPGPYPRCGH